MRVATIEKQPFGVASNNPNAKIHIAWIRDGNQVVTGCYDKGGYWIGKPMLKILETVEYEVFGEADDNNRAIAAVLQKKPEWSGQICKWCDWFRDN